jgi:hypothetical protein
MEIDINSGDIIREYRFERPLGSGAYGMVWRAYHRLLDVPVAIKVVNVRALDSESVERIKRECRIGGKLTHKEHIVEVRDAFQEKDCLFIAMELMGGGSLDGYLRERGCPNLGVTLKWALDLCAALEEVHELDVIHRDIKPQNILLTDEGQVKLADFGVAHLPASNLTTAYQPGTPAYRAPEQASSQPVDGRTDVYALCAVFFEVWSGRKHVRFRDQDPEIAREELAYRLDERYHLSPGLRDRLTGTVLAGLRPRAARASLMKLKATLSDVYDDWQAEAQREIEAPTVIGIGHERYLKRLTDAYQAFFRDRFVHQAMDAVEIPIPSKPDTMSSDDLPDDPLMVDLVALMDKDVESETQANGDVAEIETRPVKDLRAGLTEYETIALLGAPGAGKTSALLWLLGTWQEAKLGRDRLPVFVSLSRYNEGSFEDFLTEAWAPSLTNALRASEEHRLTIERAIRPLASRLGEYLAEGRAVLLLDALNELPRGLTRPERLDRLRYFVREAAELGNWVMVSCRQQDYAKALRSLQRIEIRPLDDDRIHSFLKAYLGPQRGDELWSILEEPRYARLRELIRNPFLLAGLSSLRQRESGALPTVRADLLNRLAALSIGWEQRKGHLSSISQGEQEKVLGAMALAMTTLGKTIVTKGELAERLPDAWFFDPRRQGPLQDTVLRLAQGARLARWTPGEGGGAVTFEHQVWQEYYAARLLAGMHDPEWRGLARYATGQNDAGGPYEILRTHLHDSSWRNIVLMTASQLNKQNASAFINNILGANSLWEAYLHRDARLAAACLTEGAPTDSSVIDQVLNTLNQARSLGIQPLTRHVDRARMDLLIAQERFHDLVALTQNTEVWWETRLEIVSTMLEIGRKDEVAEALQGMARDKRLHRKMRREAAERLEEIGRISEAIEAWSILENDPEVGKGIQRIARKRLRRLR